MIVAARKLNSNGITVDFREIKKQTNFVVKLLDYQYLNEIVPFDKLNPTALLQKILSSIFLMKWDQLINTNDIKVKEATIWETPRASVTYSQGDL